MRCLHHTKSPEMAGLLCPKMETPVRCDGIKIIAIVLRSIALFGSPRSPYVLSPQHQGIHDVPTTLLIGVKAPVCCVSVAVAKLSECQLAY